MGRVTVGPRPEPVVPGVYRAICALGKEVVAAYDRARHGVGADRVRRLGIAPEMLEAWSAALDKLQAGA